MAPEATSEADEEMGGEEAEPPQPDDLAGGYDRLGDGADAPLKSARPGEVKEEKDVYAEHQDE